MESGGALALQGTVTGTMSPKADSDADERADLESISEGNSDEGEIPETGERPQYVTTLDEMPELWSHGDSLSSLLSGCVEQQQRSRNAGEAGNGNCGFVTGASRQEGTESSSHAAGGRLLWAHNGEAGSGTYQKPIPVLSSDLDSRKAQASL